MSIQIDVDGRRAKAEAEVDKSCEVGWGDAMFDWLHELLFERDWPAWIAWGIIAAAMLYLATHVALAFARGWFPVRP